MNPDIIKLQRATTEARKRLNDPDISVRIDSGRFQVVRIRTMTKRGVGQAAPMSDWLASPDAVVDYLRGL